jgi:hypothetical protein
MVEEFTNPAQELEPGEKLKVAAPPALAPPHCFENVLINVVFGTLTMKGLLL